MTGKEFLVGRLPPGRYLLSYDTTSEGVDLYRAGRPAIRPPFVSPAEAMPEPKQPSDPVAAFVHVHDKLEAALRLAEKPGTIAEHLYFALLRAEVAEHEGHGNIIVLDAIREAQIVLACGNDRQLAFAIRCALQTVEKQAAITAAQRRQQDAAPQPDPAA